MLHDYLNHQNDIQVISCHRYNLFFILFSILWQWWGLKRGLFEPCSVITRFVHGLYSSASALSRTQCIRNCICCSKWDYLYVLHTVMYVPPHFPLEGGNRSVFKSMFCSEYGWWTEYWNCVICHLQNPSDLIHSDLISCWPQIHELDHGIPTCLMDNKYKYCHGIEWL
jgi:hypothetical protein